MREKESEGAGSSPLQRVREREICIEKEGGMDVLTCY